METQNKASMAKAMGSFMDSQVPSCLSVLRIDVPAEPLLKGHVYRTQHERDNLYSTEVVLELHPGENELK